MKDSRKIYIIPFDWPNFVGNHTAMGSYLANKLKSDIKGVEVIPMYGPKNKVLKALNLFKALYIALSLRIKMKSDDKVFLMEFLGKSSFHTLILKALRFLGSKNEVYGMVHLSGAHLLELNSKETLQHNLKGLNHIVVLGSSLAEFFQNELSFKDVITLFHYVDSDYYQPGKDAERNVEGKLKVLVVGNTKRNFNVLRIIIENLPNVEFHICQGYHNYKPLFEGLNNITFYGYLEEKDLLALMQKSDVSLSVMDDTIGSNVITTSLSTGMISVASDVGSIRDYLTEDESFLCKTEEDFVKAINYLDTNKTILADLKKKSVKRGELFAYPNFAKVFANKFGLELK